jgi:transcriptional regulator with XRE-family HTH domain
MDKELQEVETVFPGFAELSADVRDVVVRLAEVRREQRLSQTQIAARMGTSQSAVARLEAGQDDIRLSTLRRYADALGHTVHFGVTATGEAGSA